MSDKPRSSIKPVNIDDLKSGWHTKQHNIKNLAKELGINRWALKSYIERTLKPGIKIFGKRHFSNIDDVAEFLLKKQREIQSKPPESKIIKEPVTQIGQLKNLAKAHDMRWRTIQNALDTGANPKTLLKMLKSETLFSHDIEEHLQKTFKKKNAERRVSEKLRKNTGNKISKLQRPKPGAVQDIKLANELSDAKRLVDASEKLRINTSRLNKLNNKLKINNRIAYLWRSHYHGANEFPGQTMTGTGSAFKSDNPIAKAVAKSFTTDNTVKWTRLATGLTKTAKNLGAGLAINYLADRFIKPHTDAAARRAGIKLRKFVDRQEEKNANKKKEK